MSEFSWPIPFSPLSNDHVALRALRVDDADELYETAIDPSVQLFSDTPEGYSHEMAVDFITHHATPDSCLVWAVELAESPGRYAGSIMLRLQSERDRNVITTYNSAPWARSRGGLTQALQLVSEYAFKNKIHRIELRTGLDNTRSRTVAERNGFTFEGVARGGEFIQGDFRDIVVYAKIASDSHPKAFSRRATAATGLVTFAPPKQWSQ